VKECSAAFEMIRDAPNGLEAAAGLESCWFSAPMWGGEKNVGFAGVDGSDDSNLITGLAPFATIGSIDVCACELMGRKTFDGAPFCS
jgi:hypothetical protein